MRGKFSWVFFGYLIAEFLLLYWFWSAFGTMALISLLVAGFLLGFLVMRIAGLTAFSALTSAQRRASAFGVTGADGTEQVVQGPPPTAEQVQETAQDLGKSSLLFVAGILLAAPGIISDVLGLLLLVPLVRRRMVRRLAGSLKAGAGSAATITVVRADESGFTAQQWSSQTRPPGSTGTPTHPPVLQGEILPPKPARGNDH